MVFEPALVKIAPGDTVKLVSTDKGHNAETIKGILPKGALAKRDKRRRVGRPLLPFSARIGQFRNRCLRVTRAMPAAHAFSRADIGHRDGHVGLLAPRF